ncbi:OmpA family protein [uncultured Maribacter sp.]|uniref:OmpA family protein n=1 Tax=uncultured Maribacter sp. TaxID=431308 RepID=UPI002635286B|nr:OmpA family protein [uncultured Maribacter sp.]
MKKIFLFILFTGLLQTVSFAQEELKRANMYFERAFYTDAIPLYAEIVKTNKSSKVVKNLADSYYNTYQLPRAAKWYSYLTSVYGENLDESYFFKYSQTLKAVGEFEEATEVLMDYYKSQNNLEKVALLKEDLRHLENVDAIGERFKLENLPLNTIKSEFGATRVDSSIIYAASKKKAIPGLNKRYRWNSENYLDMYTHPLDKITLGDSISVSLSSTINTKMHEATFAITKDRKTIYFTRNNFLKGKKKTDGKKISRLKIYKAELVDGSWGNIEELPFNGDDFSTEHPALNASETIMYFASDRPGGFGSLDLYAVSLNANGEFGEPKNLGATINTEKKEQFPFIDKKNNLYFSSNGHAGFGLLDVFVSKKQGDTFQKPNNVGKPINGGYDDFSFNISLNNNQGFFASNRPGGVGGDDIYKLEETKPLDIKDCSQFIAGIVTEVSSQKPIAFAVVDLVTEDGTLVESQTASEKAEFKFFVTCMAQYTVKARKTGYKDNSKIIITDKERNSVKDGSLELRSIAQIEKEKNDKIQKAKEEEERLEKLAKEERIKEEKRKKEEAKRAKEQEEKRKEEAKIKAEKERKARIEKAIQDEPAVVRQGKRIVIKAEPKVHFDYDLWYIRLEGKDALDKIIRILKNNPGIQLEIGTHTDIRGNDNYNKILSQKRSNSVLEYLIRQGISKKRLTAKGYGEKMPIIKCETEESCTEEQHEINRRCEFVIVDWK